VRKFLLTLALVLAAIALAFIAASSAAHAARVHHVSAVTLYGEVNEKSASHVIAAIHAANRMRTKEPIFLFINSGGGNILAGGRIIDAMTASRRPIYTVNVSLAASMGAIIFSYGEQRFCLEHSITMLHDASMEWSGDAAMLASRLSIFNALMHSYNVHLAQETGLSVEQVEEREHIEWWISPAECIRSHLCTAVISLNDYPASP
jgi:ATP-dependent Clp protease protease subunit